MARGTRNMFAEILKSILIDLYQCFGVSLCFAVIISILWFYIEKIGIKIAILQWVKALKQDKRRILFFVGILYAAMVFCRTLLCRELWVNPVQDVFGIWGIYDPSGNLYTENIENVILLMPLTTIVLFYKNFPDSNFCRVIGKGIIFAGSLSLFIEFTQLFMKLGTFQLSDLFFNTLGGAIGGLFWWGVQRVKKYVKDRNT